MGLLAAPLDGAGGGPPTAPGWGDAPAGREVVDVFPGAATEERGDCEAALEAVVSWEGEAAWALPVPMLGCCAVWLLDFRLLPPSKLRRELMPPHSRCCVWSKEGCERLQQLGGKLVEPDAGFDSCWGVVGVFVWRGGRRAEGGGDA